MLRRTRIAVPVALASALLTAGCSGSDSDSDGEGGSGVSQADQDSAQQACELAFERMYDLELVEFDYTGASTPEEDAVELAVTVTGPEGSEDVTCVARQDGSVWSVDLDEVEVQE